MEYTINKPFRVRDIAKAIAKRPYCYEARREFHKFCLECYDNEFKADMHFISKYIINDVVAKNPVWAQFLVEEGFISAKSTLFKPIDIHVDNLNDLLFLERMCCLADYDIDRVKDCLESYSSSLDTDKYRRLKSASWHLWTQLEWYVKNVVKKG